MRLHHVVLLIVYIGSIVPASSCVLAHADRPCPCTYPGGTAQQGEVVCLDVNGQRQLARCEMVLNNASWHFLGTPCDPTVRLDHDSGTFS